MLSSTHLITLRVKYVSTTLTHPHTYVRTHARTHAHIYVLGPLDSVCACVYIPLHLSLILRRVPHMSTREDSLSFDKNKTFVCVILNGFFLSITLNELEAC